MSHKPLLDSSLGEFFHEVVEETLREQGLETSEEIAFYLVNLLETYARADALHGDVPGERDQPLALLLQRAVEGPENAAIPLYRTIGDRSLYISGFFGPSLKRRAVSRSYYYDMGRGAYETLSARMEKRRDATFSQIFAELADKFEALAEVLIEIRERHAFEASTSPVTDLLDRWAQARSGRAAAKLVEDGVLPLWRFGDDDGDPHQFD